MLDMLWTEYFRRILKYHITCQWGQMMGGMGWSLPIPEAKPQHSFTQQPKVNQTHGGETLSIVLQNRPSHMSSNGLCRYLKNVFFRETVMVIEITNNSKPLNTVQLIKNSASDFQKKRFHQQFKKNPLTWLVLPSPFAIGNHTISVYCTFPSSLSISNSIAVLPLRLKEFLLTYAFELVGTSLTRVAEAVLEFCTLI